MVARKAIYTLILLTLIAFKVSAATLHIHLHHSHDEEHCELCEYVINHQNLEFSTPVEFQFIENNYFPTLNLKKDYYQNISVTSFFDGTLFGRPPPLAI